MAYLKALPPDQSASWVDKTLDIGKGLLQLKQQSDIMAINRERLSRGLPPIDAGDVGANVKVGMDKAQLNKILFVGGGIVLALGLMFALSRRRR